MDKDKASAQENNEENQKPDSEITFTEQQQAYIDSLIKEKDSEIQNLKKQFGSLTEKYVLKSG